ncbi:MAG: GNAT family N-acetyltransferase [Eubacterium sp.]|nr:GNAT family N-acetyltransferase [Eubacterium sp.]
MNNKDILRIAMAQSAEDIGCAVEDFTKTENVIKKFQLGKNARKYYKEPIYADFVSYGSNTVIAASDDVRGIVEEYSAKYEFYHLFETPSVYWLNERLADKDCAVCFMAEYYLPDKDRFFDKKLYENLSVDYELRVLEHDDFEDLYLPEWGNALCKDRSELDVLGVGAYDKDKLIGLAACSADCDEMWQIGIDVLPDFRKQGIASAITSRLAAEIFERGKIPFYCSAWSNVRSVRNAIKSGFVPSWMEMTVKPMSVIEEVKNATGTKGGDD